MVSHNTVQDAKYRGLFISCGRECAKTTNPSSPSITSQIASHKLALKEMLKIIWSLSQFEFALTVLGWGDANDQTANKKKDGVTCCYIKNCQHKFLLAFRWSSYSLFTPRKPCSALFLNEECGFHRVNKRKVNFACNYCFWPEYFSTGRLDIFFLHICCIRNIWC